MLGFMAAAPSAEASFGPTCWGRNGAAALRTVSMVVGTFEIVALSHARFWSNSIACQKTEFPGLVAKFEFEKQAQPLCHVSQAADQCNLECFGCISL
jgi:hypothetical protein